MCTKQVFVHGTRLLEIARAKCFCCDANTDILQYKVLWYHQYKLWSLLSYSCLLIVIWYDTRVKLYSRDSTDSKHFRQVGYAEYKVQTDIVLLVQTTYHTWWAGAVYSTFMASLTACTTAEWERLGSSPSNSGSLHTRVNSESMSSCSSLEEHCMKERQFLMYRRKTVVLYRGVGKAFWLGGHSMYL